jgi:hypothetical protein
MFVIYFAVVILALLALVIAIIHGQGRCALWPSNVLLCIALLIAYLPTHIDTHSHFIH